MRSMVCILLIKTEGFQGKSDRRPQTKLPTLDLRNETQNGFVYPGLIFGLVNRFCVFPTDFVSPQLIYGILKRRTKNYSDSPKISLPGLKSE